MIQLKSTSLLAWPPLPRMSSHILCLLVSLFDSHFPFSFLLHLSFLPQFNIGNPPITLQAMTLFLHPPSLLQVVHEASNCVFPCCAPCPTVKRLWTTQRPVRSPLPHPCLTTTVTSPLAWGSSYPSPLYHQTNRSKSVEAGMPHGLLSTRTRLGHTEMVSRGLF